MKNLKSVALVGSVIISLLLRVSAQAGGVPFQTGDVLAGVGTGTIKHFRSDGTLVDTLNTGVASYNTGMAFDAAGNLYATAFNAQKVFKFDNKGNLLGTFGVGYNSDPESIIFDLSGFAYVGQPDGSKRILKFASDGTPVDSYQPATEDRGTDWIDLSADQCTLLYTSEGGSVKRFNLCTKTQGPDFAALPSSSAYALRIRPNGDVLVAATAHAYRLDSSGVLRSTYTVPGASDLFALNLDPDNKTFWTGDIGNGTIARIDIDTGAVLVQFNAGASSGQFGALAGLTVVGEITAATAAPPPTQSFYINSPDSSAMVANGRQAAQNQLNSGQAQDSVVVLLFGAPTKVGQNYGATLWRTTPTSVSDIASLVEDFATGYYNALGGNQTAHIRIMVATSNFGKNVTAEHGAAWAQMVNDVATWVVNRGYAGQVDIAGGSNIEPNWDSAQITIPWVNGYSSVAKRFLYNIGAATGCPKVGTVTAGQCYTGWTQDDIWYVSWGADPAEPLPEVYNTSNAAQWAAISLYGYLQYGISMIFSGTMTEAGACIQRPDDSTCGSSPNSPAQGWQQLYDKLNADVRTAQTLSWSTDIKWLK